MNWDQYRMGLRVFGVFNSLNINLFTYAADWMMIEGPGLVSNSKTQPLSVLLTFMMSSFREFELALTIHCFIFHYELIFELLCLELIYLHCNLYVMLVFHFNFCSFQLPSSQPSSLNRKSYFSIRKYDLNIPYSF